MNDFEKIGFRAYRRWLAMRNHFNYAKFTYGISKTNVKEATFLKRRDKNMFSKLGKRYDKDFEGFLISVFARLGNGKMWIGEMFGDHHDKEFKDWSKRIVTLPRVFQNDVSGLVDFCVHKGIPFKSIFSSVDGKLPPIVQLENKRLITPETAVIVDILTDFTAHIYCVHPAWGDVKLRLTKYRQFVKIGEIRDYSNVLRTSTKTLPTI